MNNSMGSNTGNTGGFGSQTQLGTQTLVVQPSQISSIQLADGWHNVDNAERVLFAVAEAHSPASPNKLYPALRYTNEDNQEVITAFSNILSVSGQSSSQTSKLRSQQGQPTSR